MNLIFKYLFLIFSIFQSSNVNCLQLSDILTPEMSVSLVKASTQILPKVDSIGHIVLTANDMFINKVLESRLNPVLKKQLILQIIDITRQGDDTGSTILQYYHDFVNSIL